MALEILKGAVVSLFSLALSLTVQIAEATPISIDQIVVPVVGCNFDSISGKFTISGTPTSGVQVSYNDGRDPNPVVYGNTGFSLLTGELDLTVSDDGYTASYTNGSGNGSINLINYDTLQPLLVGEITSLELFIEPNPDGLMYGAFLGMGLLI